MTRKHFVLIAETIKALPVEMREVTAIAFADRLEKEFPGFKRDMFVKAATR